MPIKKARSYEYGKVSFHVRIVSQMVPLLAPNDGRVTLEAKSRQYMNLWKATEEEVNVAVI